MTGRFELFVIDPQKSMDFYINVLGFQKIHKGNNEFMVQRDAVIIGFGYIQNLDSTHYFRPEITTQRKGLGLEIVLEVDDVVREYTRIKERSYPIFKDIQKQTWGLTDFRVVDPDGYYLRITSSEYIKNESKRYT